MLALMLTLQSFYLSFGLFPKQLINSEIVKVILLILEIKRPNRRSRAQGQCIKGPAPWARGIKRPEEKEKKPKHLKLVYYYIGRPAEKKYTLPEREEQKIKLPWSTNIGKQGHTNQRLLFLCGF